MSGNSFPGVVIASLVELRFPFSGLVRSVSKKVADSVTAGDTVATLDTTLLQKELDSQLADYERARADFEIFHLKNKNSDDITGYQKKIAQAQLDAAVKDVEIAKIRLDQARLVSPVTGLVIDIGNLLPGLNITPSTNPVTVLDFSSFIFRISLSPAQLPRFSQPTPLKIRLPHFPQVFSATPTPPLPGPKASFYVDVPLEYRPGLLPGLSGSATISK